MKTIREMIADAIVDYITEDMIKDIVNNEVCNRRSGDIDDAIRRAVEYEVDNLDIDELVGDCISENDVRDCAETTIDYIVDGELEDVVEEYIKDNFT